MRRNLKVFALIVLGMLVVFAAVKVVKKRRAELKRLAPPRLAPLPVETVAVRKGILAISEHYLGEIRPLVSARLSSRITGRLLEVRKYEGEAVRKGEVLALVDDRDLRARRRALEAELAAAQKEFLARKRIHERDRLLYENKALSEEAYELSGVALSEARARVIRLREELKALEADLSYAVLRAPFSGVVSRRLKEPGDLVLPGSPVLELEDPGAGYRVLVRVPQHRAADLRPGLEAVLSEGSRRWSARVFRVHPAVAESGLATVEIRVPKRPFGLPSGARVGVDLILRRVRGSIVPLKSILETTEGAFVFAVRGGEGTVAPVRVVRVEVLGRSGRLAAVKGELSPEDRVIVASEAALLRLHQGMRVRIHPLERP